MSAGITSGLWSDRRKVNRTVSIPDGWQRLHTAGNVHNLRLAAGTTTGEYVNDLPFMDSDIGKWLEAVAWTLAGADASSTERDNLQATTDECVELLAAAQESDGYLNSFTQVKTPGVRWQNLRWGHEHYTAGHFIQAGIAHHRATGREDLLTICVRLAECIESAFGLDDTELPGVDGHPEIEMALVELYREVGDRRYLDLARHFLDRRGHGMLGVAARLDGSYGAEYWQDHEPVRSATEAVGHTVRQVYLLCGMVDVAVESGDAELLASAERIWSEMVTRKTYITGGVGAHYQDEAFGEAYELPTERAYAETCAGIAIVMLCWRLLLATGKSRYADHLERTMYNAVLPGVSLDGARYSYVNVLRVRGDHVDRGDASARRIPWFRCACCPPNMMRTLASLEHYVMVGSATEVVLCQYISGSYSVDTKFGEVQVTVDTEMPWAGDVAITVSTDIDGWTLVVRDPAWSTDTAVDVTGLLDAVVEKRDGWMAITATWREGDIVNVGLGIAPRFTAAQSRVDSVRGAVALERGPLVYCLEEVDNPGIRLDDVVLLTKPDVQFVTDQELDAVAIRFPAAVRIDAESNEWWPYSDWDPGSATATRAITLTAVPYFAWGNRAVGAMRVWLPVE